MSSVVSVATLWKYNKKLDKRSRGCDQENKINDSISAENTPSYPLKYGNVLFTNRDGDVRGCLIISLSGYRK